jgi:ABC-type uncharacterized transport system auxiliary subunit
MARVMHLMVLLALIAAGLAGCASTAMPIYSKSALSIDSQEEPGSLFSSDAAILSDEDVIRILQYRYIPEPQNKMAVMSVARGDGYYWSSELAQAAGEVQARLMAQLQQSPLVREASLLPDLLIPKGGSVGHYREAAARYQADLLLVYRAYFRTYEKSRIFSADTSKASCTVEAVLLDTRTGIVPYTVTISQDFTTSEQADDLSFYETRRRAEVTALGDALAAVAQGVVDFLARQQG